MKHLSLCLALVMLGSGFGQAQEVIVPARLTLGDALRLAREHNPSLLAAANVVEIAQSRRVEGAQRLNPALTVESEGYPLFESNRSAFFNDQAFKVRIDQEIETAARRRLRTTAAENAVDVAESQRHNRVRELELEVQRAYFQVVLANADRELAQTTLGSIDQVLTVNRARFERGDISGAELRRLQVERLRFADDVFAAELALRNARSALLALINAPDLGQVFDAVEPLEARDAEPVGIAIPPEGGGPPDASALLSLALRNRPDLTAAREEQQRADSETRLQRALRTPNITLGGGYIRDFGSDGIIASFTVPLPFANRNQGGIARADAERRLAANELTAAETVVRRDVQQAINAVQVNRARVAYIRGEYLKSAQESRDIVLASYRLGALNVIDFLDAERALRDAQRTYNRALYEERVSLFQLGAAAGVAPAQN